MDSPARRRGLGRNPRGLRLFVLVGRAKKQKITFSYSPIQSVLESDLIFHIYQVQSFA